MLEEEAKNTNFIRIRILLVKSPECDDKPIANCFIKFDLNAESKYEALISKARAELANYLSSVDIKTFWKDSSNNNEKTVFSTDNGLELALEMIKEQKQTYEIYMVESKYIYFLTISYYHSFHFFHYFQRSLNIFIFCVSISLCFFMCLLFPIGLF